MSRLRHPSRSAPSRTCSIDPTKVSPATVERVTQAIAELGFVRNDAARQLRAGRSRSIGLIVLDVGNPFFAEVARGAEDRGCRGRA